MVYGMHFKHEKIVIFASYENSKPQNPFFDSLRPRVGGVGSYSRNTALALSTLRKYLENAHGHQVEKELQRRTKIANRVPHLLACCEGIGRQDYSREWLYFAL
jgi:hypothetical protein